MNYYRIGFTESTLLLEYYIKNVLNIHDTKYISKDCIKWLYTTSGFYDKKIEGNYFNCNVDDSLKSDVYNRYFEKLLNIVKNNDGNFQIYFHNTPGLHYKNDFLSYINNKPINIIYAIGNKFSKIYYFKIL